MYVDYAITTGSRTNQRGDGAGNLDTELGGLVAETAGLWLTFTSPVGRDSYDVGLMQISNEGPWGGRSG